MNKIAVMFVALALLAGCNTIHGLGKDVEKLGETVQGASKK